MVLRCIEKMSNMLIIINEFIARIVLGLTMIIGILQVFSRYFLHSSIMWSEEVMRYMLLWLVFITLPIAVRSRKHISLDILNIILGGFSPKIKKWIEIIINLIGIIVMVIMTIYSIKVVALGKHQIASSINIQFKYIYIIVPIGLTITVFHFIELIVKEFVKKESKINE